MNCINISVWEYDISYSCYLKTEKRTTLTSAWTLGIVLDKLRFDECGVYSLVTTQSLVNRYEYIKRNDTCTTSSIAVYFKWFHTINSRYLKKNFQTSTVYEYWLAFLSKLERSDSIFDILFWWAKYKRYKYICRYIPLNDRA